MVKEPVRGLEVFKVPDPKVILTPPGNFHKKRPLPDEKIQRAWGSLCPG
jgi:hypothetical protein